MSQDLFSNSQLWALEEDEEEAQTNGQNGDRTLVENEQPFSQLSSTGGQTKGKSLVRTDLTEEAIVRHKLAFVDIAEKTKEAENVTDICRSTKVLTEQMNRQNKYFKSGGVNENMILDAKCIQTNASIGLQLVKRLQTDSKQFDSLEFAEKLLTALNPFNRIEDNPNSNDSIDSRAHGFDQSDWAEFGRKFCRFHRVLPTFDFINGSFDSSADRPTEPKQSKARAQRQPKPVLAAKTEATQLDPNTKATEDSTPEEVELILKTVQKLEKKNDNNLPYIEVITNPQSIAQTVENIFHSTFLVKDGLARIVDDSESGGPVIQSIDNAQIDVNERETGIQSVFSFSMKDWQNWINRFDITRPAIRHPKKK